MSLYRVRSTNEVLSSRPFKREIGELFRFHCKDKCEFFGVRALRAGGSRYGQSCLTRATIGESQEFIESVFREVDSASSSQTERTQALESFFWDSYLPLGRSFQFMLGERSVCETTAAFLLGYVNLDDDDKLPKGFPGGWKSARNRVLAARQAGLSLSDLRAEDLKLTSSVGGVLFYLQLELKKHPFNLLFRQQRFFGHASKSIYRRVFEKL